MSHILIVHDSESIRSELSRALAAEGCTVAEAASAAEAVREIWAGNFAAVLFASHFPNVGGVTMEEHLKNLAPEVLTMKIGKDPAGKLARKVVELLEGGAVAA